MSSEILKKTLVQPTFLMMLHKDLRQMCMVTTLYYVVLRAMGKNPRSGFFLLIRMLGDSTYDRDHSVRGMWLSVFGAFDNDGMHASLLLNQIRKASYTLRSIIINK